MKEILHRGLQAAIYAVMFLLSSTGANADEPSGSRTIAVKSYCEIPAVQSWHIGKAHTYHQMPDMPSTGEGDPADRQVVGTLSITTEGYGEVEGILGEYMETKADTLKISGFMDKYDFRAVWRYIYRNTLGVLDLEDVIMEDDKVPPFALYHYELAEGDYDLCIGEVILPEGITEICTSAFAMSRLEKVNIPTTIKVIGDAAFGGSKYLSCPLDLPEGVEEIGRYSFADCVSLTQVSPLPSTLRLIRDYAFYGTGITEISFLEGLETIDEYAFAFSLLEEVYLPDSCKEIGSHAFWNSPALRSVRLPGMLQEIRTRTFADCPLLEKIEVPASCREIRNGAFENCTRLSSVALEEGLVAIGEDAFRQCSLGILSLPSTLTSLGSGCFMSNSGLRTVYSKSVMPPVCTVNGQRPWEGAFDDMAGSTLYVPVGSGDLYRSQWGWDTFGTVYETLTFPGSGANPVNGDRFDEESPVYDLNGKRVARLEKGRVYVRDGRKMLCGTGE